MDTADGACWLGGVLIDAARQGRGLGTAAVGAALRALAAEHGFRRFALAYDPANVRAAALCARLGFRETGEREGEEVAARLER
ncbi:MAG TPA: GNAT family protein [Trueperaceae bacterium]|nr:GNAT family protein [Trueperaceae bacterium]